MFNTRFAMEVATALFTALLGLIICAGSARHGISWNEQGPQAGFFPFYIGCMVLIGSAVNLAQAVLARRRLNGHFIESGRVRDVGAFFAAIIMFAGPPGPGRGAVLLCLLRICLPAAAAQGAAAEPVGHLLMRAARQGKGNHG